MSDDDPVDEQGSFLDAQFPASNDDLPTLPEVLADDPPTTALLAFGDFEDDPGFVPSAGTIGRSDSASGPFANTFSVFVDYSEVDIGDVPFSGLSATVPATVVPADTVDHQFCFGEGSLDTWDGNQTTATLSTETKDDNQTMATFSSVTKKKRKTKNTASNEQLPSNRRTTSTKKRKTKGATASQPQRSNPDHEEKGMRSDSPSLAAGVHAEQHAKECFLSTWKASRLPEDGKEEKCSDTRCGENGTNAKACKNHKPSSRSETAYIIPHVVRISMTTFVECQRRRLLSLDTSTKNMGADHYWTVKLEPNHLYDGLVFKHYHHTCDRWWQEPYYPEEKGFNSDSSASKAEEHRCCCMLRPNEELYRTWVYLRARSDEAVDALDKRLSEAGYLDHVIPQVDFRMSFVGKDRVKGFRKHFRHSYSVYAEVRLPEIRRRLEKATRSLMRSLDFEVSDFRLQLSRQLNSDTEDVLQLRRRIKYRWDEEMDLLNQDLRLSYDHLSKHGLEELHSFDPNDPDTKIIPGQTYEAALHFQGATADQRPTVNKTDCAWKPMSSMSAYPWHQAHLNEDTLIGLFRRIELLRGVRWMNELLHDWEICAPWDVINFYIEGHYDVTPDSDQRVSGPLFSGSNWPSQWQVARLIGEIGNMPGAGAGAGAGAGVFAGENSGLSTKLRHEQLTGALLNKVIECLKSGPCLSKRCKELGKCTVSPEWAQARECFHRPNAIAMKTQAWERSGRHQRLRWSREDKFLTNVDTRALLN